MSRYRCSFWSILQDICLTNCRNSLFERLIRWEDHEERSEFIGILRRQGRMHPEIAEFPNRMFYRREKLEPVPCPHQLETELSYPLPSLDATDDLLKNHRMIFLPSQFCKEPNVSDKINANEAEIVVDMLRRIHRFYGERFDAQKTVGVIVPYRNQIAMVRKGIEKLGIPELVKISIDTVERYQGSQRDVIIYSFTIQNIWQLDFLAGNSFVEDGPVVGHALTTIPQAVLGGCTIMMFGSILYAGFGMMARTGFSQRNMVIVSLSLSVGLGFTQATEMFKIFPEIVRTVFAENCVAVVFLLAVLLNLLLPKKEE